MELKLATPQQFDAAYQNDLAVSFPKEELAPFASLRRMTDEKIYRPWCLFDGGEIVAEAFVFAPFPGFAMLDYLCVSPKCRNGGLGAKAIQLVREAERENVLFGGAEIPAYAPDPALAQRRLAFYRRNGAQRAHYDSCEFGALYHTLFWAQRAVTDEELRAAHMKMYRRRFPAAIYEKYIVIPWNISMGVPEKTKWTEETDEDLGI